MKPPYCLKNFLSKEDHKILYDLTLAQDWKPVNDDPKNPQSGYSGYNSIVRPQDEGAQILLENFLDYPELMDIAKTNLYRAIYNKYDGNTPTYFHVDSNKIDREYTAVYFPDMAEFNFMNGGETQLVIEGHILGFFPEPNSIIFFDAGLQHKGTSFNNDNPRYSVALQFKE